MLLLTVKSIPLASAFVLFIIFFTYLQVIAYNSEGKSSPSETVEYITCPDKPGVPSKPTVKGKIHAQSFKITWGKIVVQLRLEYVLCILYIYKCFIYLYIEGQILLQ